MPCHPSVRFDVCQHIWHIRLSSAGIRLARGNHERGEIQTIYEELEGACTNLTQIGRDDEIEGVGALIGQVLAMGPNFEEALTVLGKARSDFEKLGMPTAWRIATN